MDYAWRARTYDRLWGNFAARTADAVLDRLPADLPGGRLLDVGCGTGVLLEHCHQRRPDLRPYGAEPSAGMRRVAARRLGGAAVLVAASAEDLPFPAGHFGAVTCLNVAHYWRDPGAALRELRRVLRPGGTLLLEDYVRGGWPGFASLMRVLDRGTVRVYRPGELAELVTEAGFLAEEPVSFPIDAFWRGGLVRAWVP